MKEQAEQDAQRLLKAFAQALAAFPEHEDVFIERDTPLRTPTPTKPNEKFRDRMFKNAPSHDAEHILAEKRKWDA